MFFHMFFLELVNFVYSFGRKTSNAFKELMQRRIMLFLWLQAQVLVERVFSLGRQREKLMFLGRSVLLKLLSEVGQFPWGVLFLFERG